MKRLWLAVSFLALCALPARADEDALAVTDGGTPLAL
jgi:hypothetical protein